jgi:hypothetical protein
VICYEDGTCDWSVSHDSDIHEVLEKSAKYKKAVNYVSMGRNDGSDSYFYPPDPSNIWFVRRATGTTYLGKSCCSGNGLGDLQDHWWNDTGDDRVERVSFAPNKGWFVIKANRGARWENLPDSLSTALEEYWTEHKGVVDLSVGHNGEWFIRYGDGSYQVCGVHPSLSAVLDMPDEKRGGVEWVEMGPDGTFVALFEKYTCWYGDSDLTEALLQANAT